MAKKKLKSRSAASTTTSSTTPTTSNNSANNNNNNTKGKTVPGSIVKWAAIPGEKLHVDIATIDRIDHHDQQQHHDNNNGDDSKDDDEDRFQPSHWTSQHYDSDENDDNDFDNNNNNNNNNNRNGSTGRNSSTDLFDPNPHASSNKYDAHAKFEGANDAGMLLSLEVIPGDAYRVEKRGDVTMVRFVKNHTTTVNDDAGNDCDAGNNDDNGDGNNRDKETARQSKKERLKAKRKAKREAIMEEKKTKKQKKMKSLLAEEDQDESSPQSQHSQQSHSPPLDSLDSQQEQELESQILSLQTTWSISAPGLSLHPTLATGLHRLNYTHPTPIQSATLPAAILGRRDIVGAAPTGSGKTLSFGIPILQYLLETASPPSSNKEKQTPLQALVLTPTRELAMQVSAELIKTCCNSVPVGTIVGGFAEVKQRRVLEKTRPPILVATPGRLWELMSSNEYSHLNNLSQIRFLVIDEADRMIKQGSFPQLQQIFNVINQANPPPVDQDDMDDDDDDDQDDNDEDRLRGLRGVRGEAKVVMLNDSILAAIEKQKNGGVAKPMEMDDDDYFDQIEGDADNVFSDDDQEEEEEAEPVHRQTFVYSATLTLPPSTHHLLKRDVAKSKSSSSSKKSKKKKQPTTVDGAIAEILDIAGARGETKIVDLSNLVPEGMNQQSKKSGMNKKDGTGDSKDKNDGSNKKAKTSSSSSVMAARLPPGLTLGQIPCAQRHKDSHLYAYLITTHQGSSGPCLVFCNSIAAVRRVGETLKTLGLPVKMLHAQMQQKSRLSALESLRKPKSRDIVVATDVAARGLDISSIATVVHYDVARMVDTFIHRAGRTARGVGAKAVGTSISLVAPAEEREHQKICAAVRGNDAKSLENVHIDGRLLAEAQERVSLATKIVSCNDVESQSNRNNNWLQKAAEECGLEVDDDMMEGGLLDGDLRDRQRFQEAKRAKVELRQLLATPIRKQRFGKFLSGAGLSDAIATEVAVKPFVVKMSSSKRRNKMKAKAK